MASWQMPVMKREKAEKDSSQDAGVKPIRDFFSDEKGQKSG